MNVLVRADEVRPGDQIVRADLAVNEDVVAVEVEPRQVVILTNFRTRRVPRHRPIEIVR